MKIINCNGFIQNNETYGGLAGIKIGVTVDGSNYIIKYPNKLKEKILNTKLSYSNSPFCEYLGSHIYELLGLPVHKTFLGERNNHIVVLCKDFNIKGYKFNEFRTIKTTWKSFEKNSKK